MLTAVVLCRDEADSLPRCLDSLRFADSILIIDDASTDDSAKIARSYGATVLTHPMRHGFAGQRNFALSQISSGWTLFVDADEVVTPELASEILHVTQSDLVDGYYLPRVDFMWGKELHYGDLLGVNILRLAKAATGLWQGEIHETWQVKGRTSRLNHPLRHYPHPKLSQFLASLNKYSSMRAAELWKLHTRTNLIEVIAFPIGKFLYIYIYKFGFLDSLVGLVHSLCMSFYTFLVRGKLYLLGKGISEYA